MLITEAKFNINQPVADWTSSIQVLDVREWLLFYYDYCK